MQSFTQWMLILAVITYAQSFTIETTDDLDPSAIWISSDNPKVACPKILKPYYLKDPNGPSYFFRCEYGFAIEYRCPDEKVFDFSEKKCTTVELTPFDDSSESEESVEDQNDDDENNNIQFLTKSSSDSVHHERPVVIEIIQVQTIVEISDNESSQYTAAFANGLCKIIGC